MGDAKQNTGSPTLRALLARTFDHAADYLEALPDRTPFPSPKALEALRGFDEPWPQHGASAQAVMEQLQGIGAPAALKARLAAMFRLRLHGIRITS